MPYNLDDLLSQLESAEKTASQHFSDSILGDKNAAEPVKVASKEATKTEPVKVASTEATNAEKIAQEVLAPELVKIAVEMGKVAAYSYFQELAALGVAMPTNRDMEVPPVSHVARPSASPVTIAGDAHIQEAVGHDGYDAYDSVKSKITPDRQKTASLITPEFLNEFKSKLQNK